MRRRSTALWRRAGAGQPAPPARDHRARDCRHQGAPGVDPARDRRRPGRRRRPPDASLQQRTAERRGAPARSSSRRRSAAASRPCRSLPGRPIAAGSTIAVIVPEGGRLEAELLAPSRADRLHQPGQEVQLILQAFPYQRFGTVSGTVRTVSSTVLGPNEVGYPGPRHQGAGVSHPRDAVARGHAGLRREHSAAARHAGVGRHRVRPAQPDAVAVRSDLRRGGAVMSILDELNFGRRRRLPVIIAAEAAECGLACMAMISRYHGHDVDLNGLRQRFALSLAGASLREPDGHRRPARLLDARAAGRAVARCPRCICRPSCTGTSIISSC